MKIKHPLILLCLIASYTLTIAQPSTGFLNSFQAFPQKNRWIAGFSSNTKTSLSYGIRNNFFISAAMPLAPILEEFELLSKYKFKINQNNSVILGANYSPVRFVKELNNDYYYLKGFAEYVFDIKNHQFCLGIGYARYGYWINNIILDEFLAIFADVSLGILGERFNPPEKNPYFMVHYSTRLSKRNQLLIEYYFQKSDQYKSEYGLHIHMPSAAIRYEYKRFAIDYGFLFLNYSRMFPKFNLYFAFGKNHRFRE
ncbi:MAG TPA: hypothetical protein PK006_04535 [Saprospiraceae bacterium]|nr:hypothetical protein [Saprospiraceae bacterium]